MKKILEVNVDDNGYGGVYAFVINIIENIDKEYQIDLCSFEKFTKQSNVNYVESFGGKIYYCGHSGCLWEKQYGCLKKLYHLVSKGNYDVIHIHSDVSYKLFLYALMAKLAKAKKVLIHSHSTGVDGKHRRIKLFLHYIFKEVVSCVAHKFLACSQSAAKWMYNERILQDRHFAVINNGINIQKFKFNSKVRNEINKKMELADKFVVGHVGRFSYQKNHRFLINIFYEVQKIEPDSVLMLIGDSVNDNKFLVETREQVKKLNIENKVLFLGIRNDVSDLMQAMDCFILPSRFEGLPLVAVEAQAAGLKSYLSDNITDQVKITDLVNFISLNESPEYWAKQILSNRNYIRKDMTDQIKKSGYDIKTEIKKIEKFYLEK